MKDKKTDSASLVIVESPAKARTIGKFLGSSYIVKSSMGHVRDLPQGELGVDIKNNFAPQYMIIKKRGPILKELKENVKHITNVYLAPDPDREGEAIAWHIAQELEAEKKGLNIYRVSFHEITHDAITAAFAHPGTIDENKVNAQQARRILDRLVGYKVSPLLWDRFNRNGLSAGRVQSVAMRLICEREEEIKNFKKEEYWSITALLEGTQNAKFEAALFKVDGKKFKIATQDESGTLISDIRKQTFTIKGITKTEKSRHPVAPFITSTLQQEAARHLGFTAKKTMLISQKLYEGLEIGAEGGVGLITYMRTDSPRVSKEALNSVRDYIRLRYGTDYLPDKPNAYSPRKGSHVQEAHEAIRPTSLLREPESLKQYLNKDEFRLYELIWKRFVASQMKSALLLLTTIDITAGKYLFRATGTVIKFDGFLKLYEEKRDEETDSLKKGVLPALHEGERLKLLKLIPKQHFTQPPPRYTEASLVRELEKKGIGRPSTYAAIMSKIQDRNYTYKEKGKFIPTSLGLLVTAMIIESFPDVFNVEFTATMEDSLDEIEEGQAEWVETLRRFYTQFEEGLKTAKKEMWNKKGDLETEIICQKCGNKMLIKVGKSGEFLACSAFPRCKNTMNFKKDENGQIIPMETETVDEKCNLCGQPMIIKHGRYGKFLACSGYPDCKNTKRIVKDKEGNIVIKESPLLDEKCPKCGKQLTEKKGKYGSFIACSGYPECKFIKVETTGIICPREGCGGELTKRNSRRKKSFYGCTNYPKCTFIINDLEKLDEHIPMEKHGE